MLKFGNGLSKVLGIGTVVRGTESTVIGQQDWYRNLQTRKI